MCNTVDKIVMFCKELCYSNYDVTNLKDTVFLVLSVGLSGEIKINGVEYYRNFCNLSVGEIKAIEILFQNRNKLIHRGDNSKYDEHELIKYVVDLLSECNITLKDNELYYGINLWEMVI